MIPGSLSSQLAAAGAKSALGMFTVTQSLVFPRGAAFRSLVAGFTWPILLLSDFLRFFATYPIFTGKNVEYQPALASE